MPVRRSEPHKDRQHPYKVSKQATMAAVLSPSAHLHSWQAVGSQTPSHNWPSQMQQYQHPTSGPEYSQPLMAPSVLVQASPQTPAVASHSGQSRPTRRLSRSQGSVGMEGPWTSEMDEILISAQARGMRWEQISQDFFPFKSANACRKRFGRAKEERRANEVYDEGRIAKIIHLYNKDGVREKMWNVIGHEASENWQSIERFCFSQGLAKLTRGRNTHARNRSRSSRHSTANPKDDSRYGSSPHEDFDGSDEHGIGLGLRANSVYHPSPMGRMVMPTVPPTTESMLHPSHQYAYGQ